FIALILSFYFFILQTRRPLRSTLFPYTTLFRSKKRGKRALKELAEQTGGVAYLLDPQDLGQVDAVTQQIARDIRNQYTIGYKKRSEEHTSELQSRGHLVCRLLLEKKKKKKKKIK